MPTLKDIVIACENVLGVTPPVTTKAGKEIPLYKARATEIGKLKKAIAKNPRLYTVKNLMLAIEYCRRQRRPVASAAALCWLVEEALKHANEPKVVIDIAQQIDTAVAWEMDHQLPDGDHWVGRLIRSAGEGRAITLNDWKEAGRGV